MNDIVKILATKLIFRLGRVEDLADVRAAAERTPRGLTVSPG
jgi:hypothetical protein